VDGLPWVDKEADVDVVIVVVILMTVIAYVAIRFIIFWHASRTEKKRKDR
jgi:hypothetical protein